MTNALSILNETGFVLDAETDADVPAREALLDRAMGEGRRRKSSEKLRRGRLPSAGLAFVARDGAGRVIGSVRLWDVACGDCPALLLGPLAVDPSVAGQGIGSALMRHALARAAELGHGAVILVGDAPYYARFGFSTAATGGVMMPGPVERDRLLGLEFRPGSLDGAHGLLVARGRRAERASGSSGGRKAASAVDRLTRVA
ncbi:GNAT family N-acetyltransferase [Hoeflea olei]|uniref:Acetyltransferase n=1 Tax=Hoeflea olei TaxID=1480615 RepID=A0A1C1Z0Z3_9HYPH|nr:N-acetyltransferase [Hoeflea olei]OCW59414.1 acetyltransferase [Hoeflea olei]